MTDEIKRTKLVVTADSEKALEFELTTKNGLLAAVKFPRPGGDRGTTVSLMRRLADLLATAAGKLEKQ